MRYLILITITLAFGCGSNKIAPVAVNTKTPTPYPTVYRPYPTPNPIVSPTAGATVDPFEEQPVTPIPVLTPTPANYGQSQSGIRLKATSPIPQDILKEMDDALTSLFQLARSRGYTTMLRHSDYTILIKDDCVNRNGTMAWLDRLDEYNGTVYDQNPDPVIGEIYRAEQVTLSKNAPPEFIICRDSPSNMGSTTTFGAEHVILYYNDTEEYERTKIHITQGHPIIQ